MGFSRQEYWSGLPFHSPLDHILSDLSTMTLLSEWPHMAWLSFIELDKAGVGVIRLASFLWLWFQCVYPLMPSRNTDHLTWVSLTLEVRYLFTAAPAKHSCCSLPWTRGISSGPPFLTCIQISQEAGQVVWYAHLFKNFPQFVMIHIVKGFGIVNKAKRCFSGALAFSMIQRMLAIWSVVPLPFLNPAWTSRSSQFMYYWSLAWRILSITMLECEMSAIVQ